MYFINRLLADKIFSAIISLLMILAFMPLLFLIIFVTYKGITHFNFDLLLNLPPAGSFRVSEATMAGGASSAILGSLVIITLAILVATPIGIFTGIYVAENPSAKLSAYVKVFNDILHGVPSIVIGVVAYVWFVLPVKNFSGFSGSLALAIMMLPMVVATTAEVVSLVPTTLKEAAYSLGATYKSTVLKIILPAAAPGILSGIIVGSSRIMGETAPLLFTAFGNLQSAHIDITKPMHSLPLLIYEFSTSAYENLKAIGWSASLLLIMIILGLNLTTKIIAFRWKVKF